MSAIEQNSTDSPVELAVSDTSFAERLNFALDKEGFPPKNRGRIQLLAEMVALTHRGASKWVNGETCPPAKKYNALAQKLNVREEWLRYGKGPMREESPVFQNAQQSYVNTTVPVYQPQDFFSRSVAPTQHIPCSLSLPVIGELFAIQLETEAMSPRFPKETIVVFDDNKEVKDGDFILVNDSNYPSPIFRQLFIVGTSMYLHAHNPKFDRLLLADKKQILGTMVQAIISFV